MGQREFSCRAGSALLLEGLLRRRRGLGDTGIRWASKALLILGSGEDGGQIEGPLVRQLQLAAGSRQGKGRQQGGTEHSVVFPSPFLPPSRSSMATAFYGSRVPPPRLAAALLLSLRLSTQFHASLPLPLLFLQPNAFSIVPVWPQPPHSSGPARMRPPPHVASPASPALVTCPSLLCLPASPAPVPLFHGGWVQTRLCLHLRPLPHSVLCSVWDP